MIRRARTDEGARLKEIAIAAKSVWGYEREAVERWADDGDFSPQGFAKLNVFVVEAEAQAVAWSSLSVRGDLATLEDLWVEPAWIGKGVGSQLFRHTAAHARALGARRLEWEAEPNAVPFYERMGARRLRDSKPSAWGRIIPIMGLDL